MPKIAKLSGTRWLARVNAIITILDQWDVLELYFERLKVTERGNTGLKAETLFQMYYFPENRLYLTFLSFALNNVIRVNKLFQSESADCLTLLRELDDLFYSTLQKIVVPAQLQKADKNDLCNFKFKSFLMPFDCINYGYTFQELSKTCNLENVNYIKNRCRDFLIKLAEELQKRLSNNIKVLEKVRNFSPEIASGQCKPNITDLALLFGKVCADIDSCVDEWNMLHRFEMQASTTDQCWSAVRKEERFESIACLAVALLTLPFSNAAVERAFSIVNIIKDKLRNKMSVRTADAILRIRFMSGDCRNFTPSARMMEKFCSEIVYESNF